MSDEQGPTAAKKLVLTPFLVVLSMELVFIRVEEQVMEAKFDQSWRDYQKKVRRWR